MALLATYPDLTYTLGRAHLAYFYIFIVPKARAEFELVIIKLGPEFCSHDTQHYETHLNKKCYTQHDDTRCLLVMSVAIKYVMLSDVKHPEQ
jgi:hypothetical protein